MTNLRFINTDFLTAALAADSFDDAAVENGDTADERVLTGLVLPFGKAGRTSAGSVTVTAGAITLPEDIGRVKLYRDHSDVGGTPVGKAISADVRDDGLYMSFRIGKTPDGDAALTDITEGIRDALSVELIDAQRDGGVLTAAQLTAVALVPIPAFDDARVDVAVSQPAVTASATESDEDTEAPAPSKITTKLAASHVTAATPRKEIMNLDRAAEVITAQINNDDTSTITAALAEITEAGHPAAQRVDWLGELFNESPFEREIIPTLKKRVLNGMKMQGWRFVTPPEVDDYEGNLAEIPTNEVVTEPVEVDAARIAGGHKIDRKFIDFADKEFIGAYLREMTNSYKRKTDENAMSFINAEIAAREATEAAQPTLLHAAARANQLIKKALRKNATTFLVNPDDLFLLFDVTMMDQPQYLSLFNIKPENFIANDAVPAGTVIAYEKNSIAFAELPNSPIRVNALDIAHGGSDHALYGYWAALVEDPRGVVSVPFGAAAGE